MAFSVHQWVAHADDAWVEPEEVSALDCPPEDVRVMLGASYRFAVANVGQ